MFLNHSSFLIESIALLRSNLIHHHFSNRCDFWYFCLELRHHINQFFIYRIGEGAYSSVYQVRRYVDNDIYALKKVKMVKLSDKEKENALNEVRILASIHH